MKDKIRLDTQTDVMKFVSAVSELDVPVFLTDGTNFRVSGKSLLGALYTLEWSELYVECERDIYHIIREFVI